MKHNILTISELTQYIKKVFNNDEYVQDIWLRGEISNFIHHNSGHMYLTLKDEGARIKAVMFQGNNKFLKFQPKDGMLVLARGYLSVYEKEGIYQFYIQEMEPDGIGKLFLAYEELKKKLAEEGLFDKSTKKPIPLYPKKIAILTSIDGAALRDILTTINRRFPIVEILIFPVYVQGELAAPSIVKALKLANKMSDIDVIILGRGGGSIEELWAFNEEIIARSIYNSNIPVISAVGHETDYTIADFVADVRAATPTAAGEIVVPHISEVRKKIFYLTSNLVNNIYKHLNNNRKNIDDIQKSVIFKNPLNLYKNYSQTLDYLTISLKKSLSMLVVNDFNKFKYYKRILMLNSPSKLLKEKRKILNTYDKQLISIFVKLLNMKNNSLQNILTQLEMVSPLNILRRGYNIAYNKDNKLIKSIFQVQLREKIDIHLQDGIITCLVQERTIKSE